MIDRQTLRLSLIAINEIDQAIEWISIPEHERASALAGLKRDRQDILISRWGRQST
jgi:hypothetical protein